VLECQGSFSFPAMAFLLAAPRVFAAGIREERVLQLEFDRTQKYLAVLTNSSLSIWSGKADRLLLAQHRRNDIQDANEGNVELIWSPGSTEIAVLAGDGGIIYYSLIKLPAFSLPVLFADPARAEGVSLQLRHRAWAEDYFLASLSRDGRAIVCGTSDGQLVRISWAGVVTTMITVTDGSKYTVAAESDGGSGVVGSGTPTRGPPCSPSASPTPALRGSGLWVVGDSQLSADEIKKVQRQVRGFYETHNPEKLRVSPVDFVLSTVAKWRGKVRVWLSNFVLSAVCLGMQRLR